MCAWAAFIYVYWMVLLGFVFFYVRASFHFASSGADVLVWARAASIYVYRMVWLGYVFFSM